MFGTCIFQKISQSSSWLLLFYFLNNVCHHAMIVFAYWFPNLLRWKMTLSPPKTKKNVPCWWSHGNASPWCRSTQRTLRKAGKRGIQHGRGVENFGDLENPFFFLEGLVNLGGSPFRFFSKLVNISPISRWFFVGDISNSFSWDFFRHLSLGGAFPGRDAAGIQGGKLPLDRGF